MEVATLARLDYKLRPFITRLPAKWVVSYYSRGRLDFLDLLNREEEIRRARIYFPLENLSRTLWGIKFRLSLMNAAGMFKNGECYNLAEAQGAGAYLGGTGTWNARRGNAKHGIYLPFTPYPRSHAASNWLGLPNDGDEVNSARLSSAVTRKTFFDCPLGWSVMGSPDLAGEEKLKRLVHGMLLYANKVDFLEMNESCPNTAHGKPQDDDLSIRLRYIKEHFLDQRTRRLPVIVKFSNDTEPEQVPPLLDLLFELGFDGVNFGNTSTDYANLRAKIHPKERRLYDFFTREFSGGVSGALLKERSLTLAARAVEYTKAGPPAHEFHVIRTGGIENREDIRESDHAGISLNMWFTGYFDNFARHGHDVYRELFKNG